MLVFSGLVALAAASLVGLVVVVRGGSLLPPELGGRRWLPRISRETGLGLVLGLVVLVVTRWPAAAVAVAVTAVVWPRIIGGAREGRRQLATLEALATWTESLRDVAQRAGLEQAIPATLPGAPALLRKPLADLVARVDGRVPLPEALTYFAEDLGDRTGDSVVAALSLNARQRAGGLVDILTHLGATTRSELEMRRKVEHQRAAVRRDSQLIAGGVLGMVVVRGVLDPGSVRAFADLSGQLVLLVIAGLFVGSFARMRSLAAPEETHRFLASADKVTELASFKPYPLGGVRR